MIEQFSLHLPLQNTTVTVLVTGDPKISHLPGRSSQIEHSSRAVHNMTSLNVLSPTKRLKKEERPYLYPQLEEQSSIKMQSFNAFDSLPIEVSLSH